MRSNGTRAALHVGDRIVIVGASLAGLRAAETIRAEGFIGSLALIGDEPYLPYDRPPLSKAVLTGWIPADYTQLPRRATLSDVEWRLGVPATGLDLSGKQLRLADGHTIEYACLLVATGTRARPWPNQAEASLEGVFTLRGAMTRGSSESGWPPDQSGFWSLGAGSPDRRLPPPAASWACP
jgi:NADPH-dependent 2,4-dienoyl-CoA reductase/sulfur reductase-like enzyme